MIEMKRLLREGKNQVEIAKHFNVSRAAISLRNKELNHAVCRNIALENAAELVRVDLNAIHEFNRLSKETTKILERLLSYLELGKDNPLGSEKAVLELTLKTAGEIRAQLRLADAMLGKLTSFEQIQEFQQFILSIIFDEADEPTRKRIVTRLKEHQAVRNSIKFNPGE